MLERSIAESDTDSQCKQQYRAIEFFAGLGGFAAAWPNASIVQAIDINQLAAKQYSLNFGHSYIVREIESLSADEIANWDANLWWMSPPCQPYSLRGNRMDIEDPRARSLLRIVNLLSEIRPDFLVLENVIGFVDSVAYRKLNVALERAGYHWHVIELCPTQFGWPNRRPRFYLIATRNASISNWRAVPFYEIELERLLGRFQDPSELATPFIVSHEQISPFLSAIDRIDNPARTTACFAASYGKAILHSGSYVHLSCGRFRRFTPREVATLLGFPNDFKLHENLTTRQLWQLLGNSLSLIAVRYVLSHLPSGPSMTLPWFAGSVSESS